MFADKENVPPLMHHNSAKRLAGPTKLGSKTGPLLDVTNRSNIATPSSSQKASKIVVSSKTGPLMDVTNTQTPSQKNKKPSSLKITSTSVATPKAAPQSTSKPKVKHLFYNCTNMSLQKTKRTPHLYETNYETNHFAPYIPELDFSTKDILKPTLTPGAFDGVSELEPPLINEYLDLSGTPLTVCFLTLVISSRTHC
jgi:hypothetical protein